MLWYDVLRFQILFRIYSISGNKIMAELLGVISGVASLFSLAIEVHRVCADYIAGVRGASKTVRNLLDELKAIKAILGELDLLLERTDRQVFLGDGTAPWFNLRDTSPCRSTLEKLKIGLEKRLTRKTFRERFSSMSWPFAEDETRQALQSLRHYHSVYEAALNHDILYVLSAISNSINKFASRMHIPLEKLLPILAWRVSLCS